MPARIRPGSISPAYSGVAPARSSHHTQLSPNKRDSEGREGPVAEAVDVAPGGERRRWTAITGPGASERPATSTESCQTTVMKSTLASRKAAKAAEKNTDDDVRERERAHAQERRIDDRGGVRQAARPEDGEPDRGRGQRAERARVGPAPLGPLDEAEREHADGADDQARAEQVGALLRGIAALLQQADAVRDRGEPDRHVDEEHEPPAQLDEEAADGRAGRGGETADRRPDADRLRALPRLELGQQ